MRVSALDRKDGSTSAAIDLQPVCAGRSKGLMPIADHQPPNAVVKKMLQQQEALSRSMTRFLNPRWVWPPDLSQRFYAQCNRCSSMQGGSLAQGKRRLVSHNYYRRRPSAGTGLAIGLQDARKR